MTTPRRLLLAALLVCAQLFAQGVLAGHSIEHALEKGQVPAHSCSVCLTGQALGSAANTSFPTFSVVPAAYIPAPEPLLPRGDTQVQRANQRAPPAF